MKSRLDLCAAQIIFCTWKISELGKRKRTEVEFKRERNSTYFHFPGRDLFPFCLPISRTQIICLLRSQSKARSLAPLTIFFFHFSRWAKRMDVKTEITQKAANLPVGALRRFEALPTRRRGRHGEAREYCRAAGSSNGGCG